MAKAATSKQTAAPKKTKAKKAVPAKKATANKSETSGIKYTDKSPGQPHLVPIFNEIVKLFKPYAKGSLVLSGGTGGTVSVSSKKEVSIAGKKQDELFLAGAMVQKGYVGFYYFPIYIHPELKKNLSSTLLKTLKGKTCFHIKKLDDELSRDMADALRIGYEFYKKNGWIR